jgi:hypothetical protein
MSIDEASLKNTLWHSARADVARYAPDVEHSETLMCPTCGRWLTFVDFSVEHIIPRQALALDPDEAKAALTTNQRSGNILLCKKRLMVRGKLASGNGCNGWKGRYYDPLVREVLAGKAITGESKNSTNAHIISLICVAYLALLNEFGYQIALTSSGFLLRHQFFTPRQFRKDMPLSSQLVLAVEMPKYSATTHHLWANPFRISIETERRSCIVAFRTLGLRLPLSRDPATPVANRLKIVPSRYKLRPDFSTAFE